MRRFLVTSIAAIATLLALAACSPNAGEATPTRQPDTATPIAEPTMTSTSSSYPKTGHAPDYSWVAGRVTFTKIQGGCIYVYTDPADIQAFEAGLTPQPAGSTVAGPFVSTAVAGNTSIPLRDMTPDTSPQPTEPPTSRFVPGGDGWDVSKVKDGDYVVFIGKLAGPNDPREICPGGTAYVVDKMLLNP